MAKTKTKSELTEELVSTKEELKVAKEELRSFEKENKLKKGEDHSEKEKVGKRWAKMNGLVEKKRARVEEIKAQLKEIPSEKVSRVSKYEYPANEDGSPMDADQKKKWRSAQRRLAKHAANASEGGDASPKKSKTKKAKEHAKSEPTEMEED